MEASALACGLIVDVGVCIDVIICTSPVSFISATFLPYTVDRRDIPGAAPASGFWRERSKSFRQTVTAIYAMGVRLITIGPEKAQICRIRYLGSPHVLNAWELPPNAAGYQWMMHQAGDTVGCGRFCLVKAWLNVLQRLMIVRDAAIQMVVLLMAWCTIETLAPTDMLGGHALAIGFLITYVAAIQTKILIVRGPSEDSWYLVETEIRQEK